MSTPRVFVTGRNVKHPARGGSRLAELWRKLEKAEEKAIEAWMRYHARWEQHPEEREKEPIDDGV